MPVNQHPRIRLALIPVALLVAICVAGAPQQHFSEVNDGTAYFHGTIGQTLEIEMTLIRHSKQIDGQYAYATHRMSIALKDQMASPFEYDMEEFSPGGAVTGHFKLNEMGGIGHPTGTREGADHKRKLSVVIGEITSEQHQLLQKIWDSKLQITSLVVGFDHACAMRSIGVLCWGDVPLMPSLAVGGTGMVAYRALPNLLIDEKVTALTTGSHRLCVLQSGAVRCWQPYDPKLALREPTLIPGFARDATMIGANEAYACAVTSGALRGENEFGQTGNASHETCSQPNGHADAIQTPCNRTPVRCADLSELKRLDT